MNTVFRSAHTRVAMGLIGILVALLAPASAEWIALHDATGWSADKTETGAARKVKALAEKNSSVHDVAFAPSGDWVLLYGGNGFWTSNTTLPVTKKIVELQATPHRFKCVAFGPHGGWVLLYDKNSFAAEGLDPEVQKALEQVASAGGTLNWIAFAPNGGWCLFHDKDGYEARRIPDDCLKHLADTAADQGEFKTISFSPSGGWAFFFGQNGFYAVNIPQDAFDQLVEIQKTGSPRFIAFGAGHADFDPNATYVLEAKPAHRIHATLSTDIALPNAKIDGWYLYAPEAPNLPSQREMKTTFEPAGENVREESPLERELILARLRDHRQEVHTMLTIDGLLYSRQLRILPEGETAPPVQGLLPEQIQHFTRVSPTSDIESKAFRDWMRGSGLTRAAGESDLVFAYRVFAFIKHHNTYEWPTKNHTATQVCSTGLSDCGGLSALFTGVMRANGIPARMLGGRWAASQKPGDKTGDYGRWHVKAEFFARGIGWVPVDGSSALADPNGENTCFGNDHGDHVAFILDEDMVVNSFVAGPNKVPLMQGIMYWWRGRGSGNDSRFADLWTVEQVKQ